MKAEDLKNYGKGFSDWTDAEYKQLSNAYSQVLMKQLGVFGSIRLMWKVRGEKGRLKQHDWSTLRAWGFTDQKVMDRSIESLAMVKALSDMLGAERAFGIVTAATEKEGYSVRVSMLPSADDLRQCGDAFAALRQYMKAYAAAEDRSGLAKVVVTEESDSAIACRTERCAMLEIAKAFGNPYLAYPGACHSDEVVYSRLAAGLGLKSSFTSMATGAPACVVRVERTSTPGGAKGSK